MQKKITVTGANKVYFTVLAVFITISVFIGILGGIIGKDITDDYFYFTIVFTQFVLILLPVLIYIFKKKLDAREVLRINKLELLPAALIVLLAIPAIFASIMFNSIAIYLIQFIGNVPNDPIPVPQTIFQLIIGVGVVGIAPAICEEALHRGVLLKAYERRGSIKAVFISAIMFGFFHFDVTNFLSPIFLGILIGYYVLRTNSIFAGVLAHFLHNSILEVIGYIYRDEATPSKVSISNMELIQSIFFGIFALIIILLLLKVFKRVTENSARITPPISSTGNDVKSILSHWPIIVSLILYVLITGISILDMVISKLIN
ncbi:MAG: CPBP family intramembrane metalloprotease [Clostridia bacterium]|nr:CPBP family intramembrane metalloprotease [Clostridia bacterium]